MKKLAKTHPSEPLVDLSGLNSLVFDEPFHLLSWNYNRYPIDYLHQTREVRFYFLMINIALKILVTAQFRYIMGAPPTPPVWWPSWAESTDVRESPSPSELEARSPSSVEEYWDNLRWAAFLPAWRKSPAAVTTFRNLFQSNLLWFAISDDQWASSTALL